MMKEASDYSIYNMVEIHKSELVGCYYCKNIYMASLITETTDEGKTALCAKCGIDRVLPDTSPFKLDANTLAELNKRWF